eukprot:gnl/MRDRNA2_/MRDRNA2_24313_c0_seq1.p1 gnl/MRDRNA2_/MRDRNA2_24313_c0~~gnl/MRDRNA2_/MRDRNA2_24313_c0_seq1.p1  ORF type:complete len:120 (-),score=9.35 gnl/MRDRNA2_/MRDRNA2_24313_c0_seq1:35-394(-)
MSQQSTLSDRRAVLKIVDDLHQACQSVLDAPRCLGSGFTRPVPLPGRRPSPRVEDSRRIIPVLQTANSSQGPGSSQVFNLGHSLVRSQQLSPVHQRAAVLSIAGDVHQACHDACLKRYR